MLNRLRQHTTTILVAATTALVMAGGPALARAVINADTVDGFRAVSCGTSVAHRAGRLVATCTKNGRLPNNVIATAPNAARLGGAPASAYVKRNAVISDVATCTGSSMVPADTTNSTGDGPGVFSPQNAFRCDARLPNHATVRSLKAFVQDSDSTGTVGCFLIRENLPNDSSSVMAQVGPTSGPGTPGRLALVDSTITHPVVDKVHFAYRAACAALGGTHPSTDLALGVYAVMVSYRVPASAT